MPNQRAAPGGEIVLYRTEDGATRVECRFQDETLWLTQALMAQLFQVKVPTINEHLKRIFAEGEVSREATVRNFRIVRQEGDHPGTQALEEAANRLPSESPAGPTAP